ncbi:DUF397 domain-containing protein [Amycolatopsis anabasis]|uniref:DUF397 domain-containing protein n=1 Tax=Amycolatopsis anabasis TaxID=1840409 RepID=UPI00131DD59A|nr:DUF397 domain-containing protein [Amycolatopsis anabasis]
MPGAAELTAAVWRKSSRSSTVSDQHECVEVAFVEPAVAVRDSKRPEGGALIFSAATWRYFLRTATMGE